MQVSHGEMVEIRPRDASSALNQFAYIVSHDIRNTARALSEIPKWLIDDLKAQGTHLSEDMQENVDLLDRYSGRLDQMLTDLLVFSRVGRRQRVEKHSVTGLVSGSLERLGLQSKLHVELAGQLPDLIFGSEDAAQLFDCLLSNAARHGGRNVVRLRIEGHRAENRVVLRFSDDGPGVPFSDLERIFDPMITLRRRDEVEGSGMGLAIVQKLVAEYGGQIQVGTGLGGGGFCLQIEIQDAKLSNSSMNKKVSHE